MAGACLAYAAALLVFQRVPLNADENSYLFQAHLFASGRVARPFPPYQEAFRSPMIITCPDLGWLSRYAPGHSLFLAPGLLLFRDPYLWVAIAAGMSLFLVYVAGSKLAGPRAGGLAAACLAVSPSFIFYHGTLLSHSSGVLATAVLLACYIHWRQNGSLLCAAGAGLGWAWLFMNRTYTSMLMAVPLGLDSLAGLYRERTPRMLGGAVCFALCAALGGVGVMVYNALTTGDPLFMTYLGYTQTQRLGFGIRHFGRIEHTPARGLRIMIENLTLLDRWLWGFPGSLAVCAGLAVVGWKRQWSRLLTGTVLAVAVGYVYFWYAGPREAGPGYYLELLPLLVLAASFGLDRILQRFRARYVLACLAVPVAAHLAFTLAAGRELRAANKPRAQIRAALLQTPPNSLVFIDFEEHRDAFEGGNCLIVNLHGLEGDPLVARWLDMSNQALARHFPDRTPWKLVRAEGGLRMSPMPARMDLTIPATSLPALTGEDAPVSPGTLVRRAAPDRHSAGFMAYNRRYHLYPGRFAVDFEVQAAPGPGGLPAMIIEVAGDGKRDIIASRAVGRREDWTVESMIFEVDRNLAIEPRAYYLGYGEAKLAGIRIRELE